MKNLSSEKKRILFLSFFVITFHFVAFLPSKKTVALKPIPPQKIIVHTFVEKAKPAPKIKTVTPKQTVVKKSIKKAPIKKVVSKAKKIVKKQAPPKAIAKKSKAPPKKPPQKPVSNFDLLQKQREYETKVISYFQESLVLPEHGTVKVEITIWKNGKIKECKVLSFENEKNKIYLEKMMGTLQLPSIMGLKKSSDTHTLTFTFCNISQ